MRAYLLRCHEELDMGAHIYITKAIGVKPIVIETDALRQCLLNDKKSFINSLDIKDDLFLAFSYTLAGGFKREWLPNVKNLGLYIHAENVVFDVNALAAIPIVPIDGLDNIIQAPFILRPYFQKLIPQINRPQEPAFDVVWIGCEDRKTNHHYPKAKDRKEFLDQFQNETRNRFNFMRISTRQSVTDYAKISLNSKIAIHLHGSGEHCFRFMEALYMGICLISQKFKKEKLWVDPGPLVPTFSSPEEAADICADLISSGAWRKLASQQQEWYKDNYGEKSLIDWGRKAADAMFRGT